MTTTKLKILGHRNKVTKAQTLSGAYVFLNGIVGTPGQPYDEYEQHLVGRMHKHFRMLQNKFHE